MTEYDQERLTAMADALEDAKETIRALELEIRGLKSQIQEMTEINRLRDAKETR